MADSTLSFVAENVGADTTEYSPECVVYLIAFGTGNPEAGGHCWTFSPVVPRRLGRLHGPRGPRATVYGGIESFRLHRSGVKCASTRGRQQRWAIAN